LLQRMISSFYLIFLESVELSVQEEIDNS